MKAITDELYEAMTNRPPLHTWNRFLKSINALNWKSCWEWKSSKSNNYGHGQFWVDYGLTHIAHRWMAIWTYGDIDGLVVDHLVCDNPPCVNPLHLLPTTQRNNVLRGSNFAAVFSRRTHCDKGHELTLENQHPWYKKKYGDTVRACFVCHRARDARLKREARARKRNGTINALA